MKQKLFSIGLIIVGVITFVLLSSQSTSEEAPPADNYVCLKCHGKNYYSFENEYLGREVHKRMNPYFVINNNRYKAGVHYEFACTDCHLPSYETYPHDAELKLEPQYGCLDCHGDDPAYAKFHFDEIGIEVENSIHKEAMGEDFNCESCHNPHYYRQGAGKNMNIKQMVSMSNEMCLKCHNYEESNFYLLTDSCEGNRDISHEWLPNKELHFSSVRCIDCHAEINDSLLVSHNILGKEDAAKNCVDCHSSDSRLKSTLYKHLAKENRDKYGFINGAMMNETFVIGATKNYYLNAVSIALFSLVILIILGHALLRIILKK